MLNIVTDIWPQYSSGKVSISISKIDRKMTNIKYRAIEYIFKTGVSNSDECVTKIIKDSNCSKCFYISGTSWPICNSTLDFDCIWGLYNQWQKCLLNKHVFAYVPQMNEIQTHEYTLFENCSKCHIRMSKLTVFGIFNVHSKCRIFGVFHQMSGNTV